MSKKSMTSEQRTRQRKAVRNHYLSNKQQYIDKARRQKERLRYLIRQLKDNRPCTDCNRCYPYYVMDFDHREPAKKLYDVHKLDRLGSVKKIMAELEKCDLVCANCHRARTHQQTLLRCFLEPLQGDNLDDDDQLQFQFPLGE